MAVSQAFHKVQLNMCQHSINWVLLQSRRNWHLAGINRYLVN